ncbi:MAG: efflux RND transporter periplasmic adaptor subunit [bacterium]|nr:efflux RND transporter periplasmic adaptor subunit [bacterium]
MKKALIAIGVVVVIGIFVVLNLTREGSRVEVRVVEVQSGDIIKYVTASGRIQPTRQVKVSASAIGKITRLNIKEGDYVEKGDFLLQIDPIAYQSAVDQLKASIRAAEATVEMERINLRKAELDLERTTKLYSQNLVSEEELRNKSLDVDENKARKRSSEETLARHVANLKKASHDLSQVHITADMTGIITELNVEEGESAIMGTLNNPGTVLLTIADLDEIEAEIQVDETEIVFIEVGQVAIVSLDAYPDSSFAGVVTEVGNSAIRTRVGMGQSSVDFKVVVSVRDRIPNVRPGLSTSVRIKVAEEKGVLSIPIQCVTVRTAGDLTLTEGETAEDDEDIEGVFVVEDGVVRFARVRIGIAGSSQFHVLDGLSEEDEVVSGPFKAINDLRDGDLVKVTKPST